MPASQQGVDELEHGIGADLTPMASRRSVPSVETVAGSFRRRFRPFQRPWVPAPARLLTASTGG